jgi:hypothetical protein
MTQHIPGCAPGDKSPRPLFADGGIVRKRKNVDGFDLLVVRILILLRHIDRGDVAFDVRFHIGVLQRHRNEFVAGLFRQERAASGNFVLRLPRLHVRG